MAANQYGEPDTEQVAQFMATVDGTSEERQEVIRRLESDLAAGRYTWGKRISLATMQEIVNQLRAMDAPITEPTAFDCREPEAGWQEWGRQITEPLVAAGLLGEYVEGELTYRTGESR